MRIITLNMNGIRAAARKGFFDWAKSQRADFICVQELKAREENMTDPFMKIGRMKGVFHYAQKKGYSGVGIWSSADVDAVQVGLGDGFEDIDAEGRFLRVDAGNMSVISLYLPSGSSSPERQEVKFDFMARFEPVLKMLLDEKRDILICGDFNIAHTKKDIKNWRSNQKNSGFLPEERAWMTKVLTEIGWVDAFRVVNADADQYTWWSNRGRAWEKNVGWRIDYQLATPSLAQKAYRASIYKEQRFSDHAPLIMDYATE